MFIVLLVLIVSFCVLLVMIGALRPTHSKFSIFELERRAQLGDGQAKKILLNEKLFDEIISLQRILCALLLVVIVLLSILTFGWLLGILVSLLVALEYNAVSRIKFIRKSAQKIYNRHEDQLIVFIQNHSFISRFLRVTNQIGHNNRIDSLEELQHIVDESEDVLTTDEKKLIVNGLSFSKKLVRTVMTSHSGIKSIKKSEFLGPLTLDDLYKTGHSRLPVINNDINHIVGILHLQSLLALDVKRSTTAEKAMDPRVFYVHQDQTLQQALATFLRTHCHLLIVVNESRETVGLLSLKDILEELLGRKIVDEFDSHDDLRSVALRSQSNNNHSEKYEEV